jgi:hypothetical protein
MSAKIICKQKKNQYFFTLPPCRTGKTIGGYCTTKLKKENKQKLRKVKSCRNVHLTVKSQKKKVKKEKNC